jgi:hypothetical protein
MIADPLGDVGRRRHYALGQRSGGGELEMLILTLARLRHRAHRDDQFDQTHESAPSGISGDNQSSESALEGCHFCQSLILISVAWYKKRREAPFGFITAG